MPKRSLDCVASCFWSVGLFEHSSMMNQDDVSTPDHGIHFADVSNLESIGLLHA